jgi:hypothetical protein
MGGPVCELIGGPVDGEWVGSPGPAMFVWIRFGPSGLTARPFQALTSGLLYRRAGRFRYLFAGHRYARCASCGAVVARMPECGLCGRSLTD